MVRANCSNRARSVELSNKGYQRAMGASSAGSSSAGRNLARASKSKLQRAMWDQKRRSPPNQAWLESTAPNGSRRRNCSAASGGKYSPSTCQGYNSGSACSGSVSGSSIAAECKGRIAKSLAAAFLLFFFFAVGCFAGRATVWDCQETPSADGSVFLTRMVVLLVFVAVFAFFLARFFSAGASRAASKAAGREPLSCSCCCKSRRQLLNSVAVIAKGWGSMSLSGETAIASVRRHVSPQTNNPACPRFTNQLPCKIAMR